MADFTESEFREYFEHIGQQYGLENIPAYIHSVLADWQEFTTGRQYDEYNWLPQKFTGSELEYFVIYHFARYFLDGIQYDASIRQTFSSYPEVSRVNGRLGNQTLFSLDTSRPPDDFTADSYVGLQRAFITLGTSLLNERFTLEDFLTI